MKNILLTYLALIFFNALSFAQTDSTRLLTIISKLDKEITTYPTEKVYLHFNKPAYLVGDTIWFKAYVTVGPHHQLSALSNVLYADLLDSRNKVVSPIILNVQNGIAEGNMPLAAALKPGSYRVCAYTNWMRNASPDYFFNKSIVVTNVTAAPVFVSSVFNIKHNGDMVDARLTYTDKLGRAYTRKAVSYELLHDTTIMYKGKGMTDDQGVFHLSFADKPLPKQQLVTHIKLADGIVADKTLPVSLERGVADVQFFPEGGQLVNGVRSKVAFKAIGVNGLGVPVHSAVSDNEHNEVAEFTTQHAGMGIFAFTPQSGKTYTATVTLADSLVIAVNLPAAVDKGFILSVNSSDSSRLLVRVACNEATLQDQHGAAFYLVAQAGGVIYYTASGKWNSNSFSAVVPKSKFPSGLVQFTLFSAGMEPLNERVVFIRNPADELNLALGSDKPVYASGEKMSLIFAANDHNLKPVAGSFSLTVFNEDKAAVNENTESTILSHILLTSDLKGYIEEPNYYFNNPNNQTNADLDVLMLTQGYRRFDWKQVMTDQLQPLAYHPEKFLSVSGRLTTSSGKPVDKGAVRILSTKDKFAIDTLSGSDGRFSFQGLEFPDSTQLVIQGRTGKDGKNVTIELDDNRVAGAMIKSSPGQSAENLLPQFLLKDSAAAKNAITADELQQITSEITAGEKAAAFNFKQNNKLKEVNITTRKNYGTEFAPWQPVVTRSDNLNGPGHADLVLTGGDVHDCRSLEDDGCLIAKIPGIIISPPGKAPDGNLYFARHMAQSIQHTPPIIVIIDGLILQGSLTKDALRNVVVDDVITIEVLKSGSYLSIYGSNASGGALVITTRRGIEGFEGLEQKKADGILNTRFNGFEKTKQFYVPKYTYTGASLNTNDTRTAIYWNPGIITDTTGKCSFDFFNPSLKGSYRAVVEGIDDNGHIGRYVYRYKVE